MDTGPIQSVLETEVGPDEDAGGLLSRLTELGVGLLDATLTDIEAGKVVRSPQEGDATSASLIKREDARLDLSRPAPEIHDLVRGFRLWPRAYLEGRGGRLLVLKTALPLPSDPAGEGLPGTVQSVERGRGILVQCGSASRLWFLEVQPEGKRRLNAADFANGLRLAAGDFLPFVDKT